MNVRKLTLGILLGCFGGGAVTDGVFSPPAAVAADDLASNCVLFARSKVKSLPFGLNTQADKARIVNSKTPTVGSVAVFGYNHVAVVTKVETVKKAGGGTEVVVTISESNYQAGKYTTRTGTPASLNIVGYFKP